MSCPIKLSLKPLKSNPLYLWGMILFIGALLLRLLFLGHESLWIDEVNTLLVATTHGYPEAIFPEVQTAEAFFRTHIAWQALDFPVLMEMLRQNVHMPLYYILINPWLGLFGLSEWSIRGLSVLFSVLMLIPVYFLGSRLSSVVSKPSRLFSHVGFWAFLFAATSPFQLYYAQEARMYALGMFLSAVSALALWNIIYTETSTSGSGASKPSKITPACWSAIYTLATLAGIFTHYIFLFQLPFHALFGGVALLKQAKNNQLARWSHFLPFAFLLGVAVYFWFPVYVDQKSGILGVGDHFSDGRMKPLRYLGVFFWEPLLVLAGNVRASWMFYFPLGIGLFLAGLMAFVKKEARFKFKTHGFLLSWILLPLAFQVGVDWIQETHTSTIIRYTLLIAPAVYLLLGLICAELAENRIWQNIRLPIMGAMLFIAVLTVWPGSPFRYKAKFGTRDNAQYLSAELQPNDVILINGPLAAPCTLAYYLYQTNPNQPFVYWQKTYRHQGNVPKPSEALLAQYNRAWLFNYRGGRKRGVYILMDTLKTHYKIEQTALGPRRRLNLYR